MRLRTCVVLEVAVAGALAAALVVGGRAAVATVSGALRVEAADAAEPEPRADPDIFTGVEAGSFDDVATVGLFHGISDDVLLAPMRTGAVKEIKFNRGGSTISLRIDFDNGARAAFKPRQINLHSVPRYEVAAFRVNRLLGLASVAPAVGRKLAVRDLIGKLRADSRVFGPRMREEMLAVRGDVVGELSWWIPVIRTARVGPFPIDSAEGVLAWTQYLTVGNPIPHRDLAIVSQVSDMVVFDFIIDNIDRWSGGNVRMSEDGRTLYFMDNASSFDGDADGHARTRSAMVRAQKFSRSMVASLDALTDERLRAELGRDVAPFEYLLSEAEIVTLLRRIEAARGYIDGLIETHGVGAVLVFP